MDSTTDSTTDSLAEPAPPTDVDTFASQYNPFISPQLEDPYPAYAIARKSAPVFFSPALGMWVLSRYNDVCAALKNPKVFSSADTLKNAYPYVPEALAVLKEGGYARMPLTVDNDTPSHGRVRGTVSRAFTLRRIAALEPVVRAVAKERTDAFAQAGQAELMSQFAVPLPVEAILRFIGVPREDMADLKRWSDDWAAFLWAPLPPEGQVACAQSMVAYLRYCKELVAERKRSLRDDLLSDLIRAQASGNEASLSDEEMAYMVNDLTFAAQETTTATISSAVKVLLSRPERWQFLLDRPDLIPAIVEECLRIDSPAQSITRTMRSAIQVSGVTLPEGARVNLLIGSANHDEDQFPDPTRFDPERKNVDRHLSFGQGTHVCLGATLARVEARVALELLSQRLPGLRLTPGQTLAYRPNLIIRRLTALHVTWGSAP